MFSVFAIRFLANTIFFITFYYFYFLAWYCGVEGHFVGLLVIGVC